MDFSAIVIALQEYVWPVLVAILVFSFLILIHELGHFWAARRNGVKVEEFGIGFPPRIFSFRRGETLYTLNLIPFGGFVKLYGEDADDAKTLADSRSFASKSKWARVQITVAGVAMNLLFAFIALTVGFTFGMEPLIAEYDDVVKGVKTGVIETVSGLRVAELSETAAAYRAGLRPDDEVLKINEIPFGQYLLLTEKPAVETVFYRRGGKDFSATLPSTLNFSDLGLNIRAPLQLARIYFAADQEPFRRGDKIEQVNGGEVFSYADLVVQSEVRGMDSVFVRRGTTGLNLTYDLKIVATDGKGGKNRAEAETENYPFVVESLLHDSPAQGLGVEAGDRLEALNGEKLNNIAHLRRLTAAKKNETVTLTFIGDDRAKEIAAPVREDGTLGLFLTPLLNQGGNVSLYLGYESASIVKIGRQKLALPQAAWHSLTEIGRLGWLTVGMFGKVVGDIFSTLTVPEGVAGPVGIAKMTVGFAEQGFLSLLRFVAIISLSLAVLNLLPIPALDGGRLFFIALEAIRGRKIDPKTEAVIHSVGFILLMALIVLVTRKDIFG